MSESVLCALMLGDMNKSLEEDWDEVWDFGPGNNTQYGDVGMWEICPSDIIEEMYSQRCSGCHSQISDIQYSLTSLSQTMEFTEKAP